MTQGEIFAYSYHLQSSFMTLNKVKYFWCDVACKYYPWLADVDVNLSQSMTPALSVMHAKAHSPSCQVHLNFSGYVYEKFVSQRDMFFILFFVVLLLCNNIFIIN